jgi:hypothetical protein
VAAVLLLVSSPGITAAELPMLINAGVGGGWYEPAIAGQGFSIDVVPDSNQHIAYWFTYAKQGGAREWYVAQGDISGNVANMAIYQAENGLFDQPSAVDVVEVGTAKLKFNACDEAEWEYSFNASGHSGQSDLVRLGPTRYCEQFLVGASLDAVSHGNAWVNLAGDWVFEGCVQLDGSSSHGEERLVFTESTLTLEIDNYVSPDCQGPISLQVLHFNIQRVDKTMAWLDGEQVISNRFLLTDPVSGARIKQTWYVDDRGEGPLITHGVLDSIPDLEGYPSELHTQFARRVNP